MTALLARLNSRLDEIEAGPAVIGTAVFLAASIAVWVFLGQAGLNVVFITGGAVLFWNFGLLHSRADEALEQGDENKGQIEDVKTVLFRNETGNGKHAKGQAA
jgi:hypothetical protein